MRGLLYMIVAAREVSKVKNMIIAAIVAALLAGPAHAEDSVLSGAPGERVAGDMAVSNPETETVAGRASPAITTSDAAVANASTSNESNVRCTPARKQKTASSGLHILGGLLMFASVVVGAVAPVGSGAITATAAGALSADAAGNVVSKNEDRDCAEGQRAPNAQNNPS